MRYAVRALKNPTPLAFNVAQKGEELVLRVDRQAFERLSKPQQADFLAYLRDVVQIIELGGGGRVGVSGVSQ
jgi:hypothetical protein